MYAGDYQNRERMAKKIKAIPMPELTGKSVLDVGCDHGFWCAYAVGRGAKHVTGLDRNREVKGVGFVDLIALNTKVAEENKFPCTFHHINLGRQWRYFGKMDVIFLFSLYHHIFEQCGDHDPIWFWLYQHCHKDSEVLWENPVDPSDSVVRRNVSADKHHLYNKEAILKAARKYFDAKYCGPALHEPTREVWSFKPKDIIKDGQACQIRSGAGGASKAFAYADGRRISEIEEILGFKSYPGSLNLTLDQNFDWDTGYYRAQVLDVVNRKAGLNSEWGPRWARFYPVLINNNHAVAFRFEGEKYPKNFVELISIYKLRDLLKEGMKLWLTRT